MLPILCMLLTASTAGPAAESRDAYLSDLQHRFLFVQQGWGELGVDTCAHAGGQKPIALQIASEQFRKGLGHHAPGEIVIDLAGEYERFECQIGVQPLPGNAGSVAFKVFVDDALRFDSGIMRSGQPARAVSVSVVGSAELRLVAEDAGDGINCDCANWAEARLTRAATATAPAKSITVLDVAPFAEAVASDPGRLDGCRADRVHEFRAEDLFLEEPLRQDSNKHYMLQIKGDLGAGVGLRWIERRMLRELGVEFADSGQRPAKTGVGVQYWAGESLWQGSWQPLPGRLEETPAGFGYRIDWSLGTGVKPDARSGTRKIRWIFPDAKQTLSISKLTALSPTPLQTVGLVVESEAATGTGQGEIEIYNGMIEQKGGIEQGSARSSAHIAWPLSKPLELSVVAVKPRKWRADRTVLRLRVPGAAFGVGIDDVLRDGCVYVPDAGVLVRQADAATLEQYRKQIAGKKTILQQVREVPDQTLAAAMAAVHSPVQDHGPMMLSLACDNRKFITHRDGTIEFAMEPDAADSHQCKFPCSLRPKFGSGKNKDLSRHLDGGWLPAPVVEVQDGGIEYRQRTMVIPAAPNTQQDAWIGPAIGVAEFTARNPRSSAAEFSLGLRFLADSGATPPKAADLQPGKRGISVVASRRQIAFVQSDSDSEFRPDAEADGRLGIRGKLQPGGIVTLAVYFPVPAPADVGDTFLPPTGDLLSRLRDYWTRVLAPAAQIEVPDPLLQNIILASQVHCLIVARNEAEGARVAPWCAAVHYGPLESEGHSPLHGLDVLGHGEFARRAFEFYAHRYNKEGFLTTGYTLMGTGWNLWTLGQHYRLTHDSDWLTKMAREVARVCRWVMAQRAKTKRLDTAGNKVPEYGLMPPGVMADWNAFAYYFCLNGYYCAGLREAGAALADVKYPGADEILADAAAFREDILRAYQRTQAQMPVYTLRNGTYVPAYPSQLHGPGPTGNFFPGEDGNRSWCYDVEVGGHQLVPQGVLDPHSRQVEAMMDHMEDVQFLSDGWFDFPAERSQKDPFNLGGFSKVQPYYCRNGEIYALRDDVKPFIRSYFNTLSTLVSRENLSLQEHFRGVGAWNKTHETGYFLLHTRLMLVQERGEELWLAPFVTSNWLKDGMVVGIQNAPTEFGPVSYRITSKTGSGRIEAKVTVPDRLPPKAVVLRLRHPEGKAIRSATTEGRHAELKWTADTIRVSGMKDTVKVSAEY